MQCGVLRQLCSKLPPNGAMHNLNQAEKAAPVNFEFIALVAVLISPAAVSTDFMLPVLPVIGETILINLFSRERPALSA